MGDAEVKALDNINLLIAHNDYIAIMGPSGSGKSTLMNILGCLTTADAGSYLLNGQELATLNDDQLASIRNQYIGFIFQSFNLQSRRTALENVMLPLRFSKVSREEATIKAKALLERVGLAERMEHCPSELSGGQRQRVAIARALINEPTLILADEPTGNLDSNTSEEIMRLFDELHSNGQTIIMVTHEPTIAAHAQLTIQLEDGQIHEISGIHYEETAAITA
ncbi:MAG: ABC transporter ATP-binding protein [Gammaproteobacteria bacterium]|nr:ABC transporter ATP-binding protein [Gammaproteobacteria bacterium]